MKNLLKYGAAIFFIFLLVELVLRIIGFGTPVLYTGSSSYEYIYKGGQDVWRYGNRIITNSFGMRNKSEPDTSKPLILGLGDSILNGGSQTSHDELATTILSDMLGIPVLNVSAGSWGPDNIYAYLEENGTFSAEVAIWVISSHDLFDNMRGGDIVGFDRNYPGQNPPFAIYEVIDRYILKNDKRISSLQITASPTLNPGINKMIELFRKKNIDVTIYLHPTLEELKDARFDQNGTKLMEIFARNNLTIVNGMDHSKSEYYRDGIHLNVAGQKNLAEVLYKELKQTFNR